MSSRGGLHRGARAATAGGGAGSARHRLGGRPVPGRGVGLHRRAALRGAAQLCSMSLRCKLLRKAHLQKGSFAAGSLTMKGIELSVISMMCSGSMGWKKEGHPVPLSNL